MTLKEILTREYRREFEDYVHFDRGASRSIALRASRECAPGTILYRLPFRRKMIARVRSLKYWSMNKWNR